MKRHTKARENGARKPPLKDMFSLGAKDQPVAGPGPVYSCAGCEGRDRVIEAQALHIKSLERQVEIVANLADPMVHARVATAKGELTIPVAGSVEQLAAAMKARSPVNPRRWREPGSAPKTPGKPDTPGPDLDPELEFEVALQAANEAAADNETTTPQPS